VIDPNPASDADLWIAYDLLEAGRLWREPRYAALGRGVLANVAARELAQAPPLGPILLPGPVGFAVDGGFRINPSYAPPPLLQRFSTEGGPWPAVRESSLRILQVFAEGGAAPDWAFVRPGHLIAQDPKHGRTGSYDAIRVPLWVGITAGRDPGLDSVASGLLTALEKSGRLPEKIDARTLQPRGEAPPGFYGALLPIAPEPARAALASRLAASSRDGLYGAPPAYYDQNLILFAQGFLEERYRFARDGSLAPAWESRCLGRAR
jgi:endoglucanase